MHSRLLLGSLVRRASTPGVLQSSQIGACVHALRQLGWLNVSGNGDLCRTIALVVDSADARSVTNVLHAMALSTREQCDPHVSLPATLQTTLTGVQSSLSQLTDELTAPESIMATEALLLLCVYGRDGVVLPRLLSELQARVMSLAHVVERPVELLGILRVVLEAARTPAPGNTSESTEQYAGRRGGGDKDGLREWSRAALGQVVSAVEARLDGWGRQDLISLVDAISTTGDHPRVLSAWRKGLGEATMSESVAEQLRGGAVADATRPLLLAALDRTARMASQLSASQCAAWLVRLSTLRLAEHPLFPRLVHRLHANQRSLISEMSPSQLATSAISLFFALQQQGEEEERQAKQQTLGRSGFLSLTEQDACVRLYVALFARLVALGGRQGDESVALADRRAVRPDILLLVSAHLPERSLVRLLQRFEGIGTTAGYASGDEDALVLQSFANALEAACSLLLRDHEELVPSELARLAISALHWHVYGGTCLPRRRERAEHTSASSSPATTTSPSPRVLAGCDILLRFPPQLLLPSDALPSTKQQSGPDSGAAREAKSLQRLHALCGLLTQSLPRLNMIDILQLVNEATAALHVERGVALNTGPRRTSTSASTGPLPQTTQALQSLAMALHRALQDRFTTNGVNDEAAQHQQRRQRRRGTERGTRGGGGGEGRAAADGEVLPSSSPDAAITAADLSTTHLCRYLTSLSKLNIRTVKEYYTVLHLLEIRPLTPFDLLSVLYVVARHHLKAPYLLHGCVRRLPELGESLSPSQKALLLKYLGQVNAQRFVRAPSHQPLEPGEFFRNEEELGHLTYLEATFAFNGLMELRQFENGSLRWLLQGPLTQYQQGPKQTHRGGEAAGEQQTSGPPPQRAAALPLNRSLDFVKSATTLCELVVSVCRLGVPPWLGEDHATAGTAEAAATYAQLSSQLAFVADVTRAATHAIASTRSLFTDVSQLTGNWPWLHCFPRLFLASVPASASARAEREELTRRMALVEAEWTSFSSVVQAQVQRRVADIARDPNLRPNSFLIGQLAGAVCFAALPSDPRDVARLFANVELNKLPQLLGNARHLVDATIVGLYAAAPPTDSGARQDAVAEALLSFVRKHVLSLRGQDILAVWWLCERALQRNGNFSTRQPAAGASVGADKAPGNRVEATGKARRAELPEAVRGILRDIRESARAHFRDERNVAKLSPLEREVLKELL